MDEHERATEKLLLMVKTGNFSDISALLTQFPEVINGTDKNGNTPLILAAYYGNDMIVKLLIARGSDVTIKNKKGFDALYIARHEQKKAYAESPDSVQGKKFEQYNAILEMLYQNSNADQLKDIARRDSELSKTKVYIFPSIHPDESEAGELQRWIHRQKEHGIRLIVMVEFGAEENARDAFSNIDDPKKFESISKYIVPQFKAAVIKMLEVLRDEKLPLYPVDTRAGEHIKEQRKYLSGVMGFRVENAIKDGGDVDSVVRAHIEDSMDKDHWLHNRNVNMIRNIRELAEQNSPCAILMVCGAGHASEIAEGIRSGSLSFEMIRGKDTLAVQMGNQGDAGRLAAKAIRNGMDTDATRIDLLRSLCMQLEMRTEATAADDDASNRKFDMDKLRADVALISKFKTVEEMREFLTIRIVEVRDMQIAEKAAMDAKIKKMLKQKVV